ncbi:D-inositol 3-phosphate glycosyltransferase [Planctomycetes bacterium Pla163]|uniref:D-inositol 3-phosphate glycosyltransferase n=1 Tax=Rohdeia mirabilis TaxID=2528008 RepID=A0A518D087_9BACT|nr:D-inositol 3-phosphate glycosyltransferase [Planctomycetes bacterium Pla163]
MRIARVVTRMNLGGPARQVLASDPELVRRGHELRVFCGAPDPGEGDLFDALGASGVEAVRIPGLGRRARPSGDLRALFDLRRQLAAFAPDVVHTHASKAGFLGRLAAPRSAGLVHTFHGHVLEGYFGRATSRGLRTVERLLARRTDRIVAVSRATAEDLVRLRVCAAGDVSLSPPGIDLESHLAIDEATRIEARERAGIAPSAFVVGFVGRLAAVKRPALAGRVLVALRERGHDAVLLVAGDGPERAALEEATRDLPAGSVHFAGAIDDTTWVHAASDAVLSCSRSEGLPVALIEAAASGTPAVALRVGGVGELIDDGVDGRLVESPSADGVVVTALAEALERLALDPTERRRLGRAARERARANHGARGLADRLEAIYRGVLESMHTDSMHTDSAHTDSAHTGPHSDAQEARRCAS